MLATENNDSLGYNVSERPNSSSISDEKNTSSQVTILLKADQLKKEERNIEQRKLKLEDLQIKYEQVGY